MNKGIWFLALNSIFLIYFPELTYIVVFALIFVGIVVHLYKSKHFGRMNDLFGSIIARIRSRFRF